MFKSPSSKSGQPHENSDNLREGARTAKYRAPNLRGPRPGYSLATWTGAAYAENRVLYIMIGAVLVLGGSIAVAMWLTR